MEFPRCPTAVPDPLKCKSDRDGERKKGLLCRQTEELYPSSLPHIRDFGGLTPPRPRPPSFHGDWRRRLEKLGLEEAPLNLLKGVATELGRLQRQP